MSEDIDFTIVNKSMYDEWSKTYDTQPNSTIYCDEGYFPRHWAYLPPSDAIEIGCGTGRHTQKLVRLGHKVTALDLSGEMLAIAQQKAVGAEFIHANFLEYDFGDRKFDFAIMSLVLEHLPDKFAVFAKIASFLKNGGRFFLSEIHHSRMENGSGARFTTEKGTEIRAASFVHDSDEIIKAAKSAGFELSTNEIVYGTKHLAGLHDGWGKYLGRQMIEIYEFVKT